MKTMKRLAAVFFLAATMMLVPVISQAQTTTAVTGTVSYVGQVTVGATPYAVLVITPTGGAATAYAMPSAQANSMMAIALTAMSAGKNVTAEVSGNAVYNLYVNNI